LHCGGQKTSCGSGLLFDGEKKRQQEIKNALRFCRQSKESHKTDVLASDLHDPEALSPQKFGTTKMFDFRRKHYFVWDMASQHTK